MGGDGGRTGWNVEVNREHVVWIAMPRDALSVGRKFQAGEIGDRAVGRMVGRHPLRVVQG